MSNSKNKLITALLVATAVMMAVTFLGLLNGHNDRLLLEEDLPYEDPLGVGHSTTMLLGIFTSDNEVEFEARHRIRQTYLKEEDLDPRVCKLSDFISQHLNSQGQNVICQIPYVFVLGGNPDRDTDHGDDEKLFMDHADVPVILEDDTPNDVIYLNIKDNEHEGKSASYFKWANSLTEKFKIDYVAKAPTSTLFDLDLMLKLLNLDLVPAPYNRRIYGGNTWGDYKHSIVYADSAFYFLSSDLAKYVGNDLTADDRKKIGSQVDESEDIGNFLYSHPKPVKFIFLGQNVFWYADLTTHDKWYFKWFEKMSDLPTRGLMVPFREICAEMEEEKLMKEKQMHIDAAKSS
jgi:hypothetical protein